MAPGEAVWSTVPGRYGAMSGTSMATPVVSGVAALMLAQGIPATEVRDILQRTAVRIGEPATDPGALFTAGYGLVNAYGAVLGLDPGDALVFVMDQGGIIYGEPTTPDLERRFTVTGCPRTTGCTWSHGSTLTATAPWIPGLFRGPPISGPAGWIFTSRCTGVRPKTNWPPPRRRPSRGWVGWGRPGPSRYFARFRGVVRDDRDEQLLHFVDGQVRRARHVVRNEYSGVGSDDDGVAARGAVRRRPDADGSTAGHDRDVLNGLSADRNDLWGLGERGVVLYDLDGVKGLVDRELIPCQAEQTADLVAYESELACAQRRRIERENFAAHPDEIF